MRSHSAAALKTLVAGQGTIGLVDAWLGMPAHSLQHPTLRHLDQLMAQLLDGVILIDPTGAILSANAAALRMHGVPSLDALGTTAEQYAEHFSLWSADHRPLRHREYPLFRLLAGESFPDLIVEVAPVGETEARWVQQVRDVTMDEDGGEPDYMALVISDVSARFDAEARFKAMFRANPAPALIVRQSDGKIVDTNPGFLGLTGYNPAQLKERGLFALDLLQDMIDAAAVRHSIERGEVVPQTEAELLVADGFRRLVLFAGQPIDVTDEDALLLTFADLEPRRQAEQALAASEDHLSALFEMAPVAMVVTSGDRIVRINAAFRTLTGYSEEEAVEHTINELALWDTADARAAADCEVEDRGSLHHRECRLMTKAGEPVDCLASAETISMHGQPCILWLYQDISERRRVENDLVGAIEEAMKDASWLSRSIIDKLAAIRRPSSKPAADLSPREREILELICSDLDDAQIAAHLALSKNTVRNHVARIYAKLGVNRRSGAVVWGRERGMGSARS